MLFCFILSFCTGQLHLKSINSWSKKRRTTEFVKHKATEKEEQDGEGFSKNLWEPGDAYSDVRS